MANRESRSARAADGDALPIRADEAEAASATAGGVAVVDQGGAGETVDAIMTTDAGRTTATVTGASADLPGAGHASNTAPALCANCGADVSGRYCSACGQRVEHAVPSVWHFACEVAEDLTHVDSRLWRTLTALLFKPGLLTREFLAGRRVSYLPPLRLYLVLSVFFFLIATLLHESDSFRFAAVNRSDLSAASAQELARQATEIARQTTREQSAENCAKLRYTGPWHSRLEPALRTSCRRAVDDGGRELSQAFFHNLPRAIFLTVPALALVMTPLYWRPRRYYLEHLLFLLHDHAFVFALLSLFSILAAGLRAVHVSAGPPAFAAGCYIPVYYYIAMRRVYGQSAGRTLGKLTVLALAYLIAAVLVLLATAIYSVLAQ
jgi:hypothetical protein